MENLKGRMERMIRGNAQKRSWRRFVVIPAVLVVFITTYMLILPAIAKERDAYCGLEEHTHTAECLVRELTCGYEEGQTVAAGEKTLACTARAHAHTDGCYDDAGRAVCGYGDILAHVHDGSCYDGSGALICLLDEHEPHEHTEACYGDKKVVICGREEAAPHVHTEACYGTRQVRELTCGMAEGEGHAHGESCYASHAVSRLVCGLAEDGEHAHTDACYETGTVTELVCGKAESAPHEHTEACYTVGETRELTCDLTEGEGHAHTDVCFRTERGLVCGKEELILHTHTDECYEEQAEGARRLVCGKTEIREHVHGPACYANAETGAREHVHTDVCYTERAVCGRAEHTHTERCYDEPLAEIEEDSAPELLGPELVCGKAEHRHTDACLGEDMEYVCGVEAHAHGPACYDGPQAPAAEPELACEMEEHAHADGCYDKAGELVCGLAEHTHGESCYVRPAAPAQHRVLICGKDAHQHTEVCYDENMTLLCGFDAHQHTGECYAMAALSDLVVTCGRAEHTHGKSCYDENGELVCGLSEHVHGDECFALAGPGTGEPVPVLYCGLSEHVHGGGCYDDAGELTCPLEAHKHTKACYMNAAGLALLCGLSEHAHTTACYDGSGGLLCGLEEHVHTAPCYGIEVRKILSSTLADGSTISVSAPANFFPPPANAEALTLRVEELPAESAEYELASQLLEGQAQVAGHRLFDISIMDGDAAVQPLGDVTVSFLNVTEAGAAANVYHVDLEAGSVEDMGARTDADGVFMTTPHFSLYDIVTGTAGGFSRLREAASGAEPQPEEPQAAGGEAPAGAGYYDVAVIAAGDVYSWSGIGTAGTYRLMADFTADTAKNLTGDMTIDLNGHTITATAGNLLSTNGHTLTITDSSANAGTVPVTKTEVPLVNNAEKKGTFTADKKLTYYVTESSGKTYRYDVDLSRLGAIVGTGAVVRTGTVNGSNQPAKGTVKLLGGRLTNTAGAAVTVISTQSVLEIDGEYAYIVGCNNPDDGGGIYALSGTINVKKGVIAANEAKRGGGIYSSGAAVDVSGGVIASNLADGEEESPTSAKEGLSNTLTGAWGGGGVYIDKAKITISGGYITNNVSSGNKTVPGNLEYGCTTQGGGGILADGSSTVEVKGEGVVSGNYAAAGGGGIFVRYGGVGGEAFTMNGGCISYNWANYREGGGVFFDRMQSGTVNAGTINGNTTNTPNDWGGGGIFISGLSSMRFTNTVITENTAEGFGGGVGGCPTGKLFLDMEVGVAVFDNHAQGKNLTHSPKSEDHIAAESQVFLKDHNYQDIFSALASRVYKKMLGEGDANWTGSADGMPIDPNNGKAYYEAGSIMGMTAHPGDSAKDEARARQRVLITDNHSNTHGGGIMCNGVVTFGTVKELKTYAAVDLRLVKSFIDTRGNKVDMDMTDRMFRFILSTDEAGKNVIAQGYNTVNGAITGISINSDMPVNASGYFTCYLREDPDYPKVDGIVSDETVYRIQLHRTYDSITTGNMNVISYRWNSVSVSYRNKESTRWNSMTIQHFYAGTNANPKWDDKSYFYAGGGTGHGELFLRKDNDKDAFRNTVQKRPAYLHIVKESTEDGKTYQPMEGVKFYMRRPDEDTAKELYSDENGRIDITLERGQTYYLHEMATPGVNDGYILDGPWIVEVGADMTARDAVITVYRAKDTSDRRNWVKGGQVELKEYVFQVGGANPDGTMKTEEFLCLQVINDKKRDMYELPESGGSGTLAYTLGGLGLMALAGVLYIRRRRAAKKM